MPCIKVSTTAAINADQEKKLVAEIGEAIKIVKPMQPAYLMIKLEPEAHLTFGGTGDCAFVEVDRYGEIPADEADALTERVSKIIADTLGIVNDRTYVRYIWAPFWGCHGHNFK